MMKVGITGGIGCGKSTVCRLFELRGIPVYDSDAAAKRLMAGPLHAGITGRFGTESFRDGVLDRKYLAGVVFSDPKALVDLNALVHPAVQADFEVWCTGQQAEYVVLESAILFESGFDKSVDKTLAVLAPTNVRVERTCRRDGVASDEVLRRIAAQMGDEELAAKADYTLVNLFEEDMEPAVAELDRKFRRDAKTY